SAGSGSPTASIAAPPKGRSSTESSSGSASSTRTATAITSGPIPSPGRQTIRLPTAELPLGQPEHVADEVGDPVVRQRPGVLRLQAGAHRLLAAGIDDRDPARLLVLEDPPGELQPPVHRRDERVVRRRDLLAQLADDRVGHAVTPSSSSSASTSASIST